MEFTEVLGGGFYPTLSALPELRRREATAASTLKDLRDVWRGVGYWSRRKVRIAHGVSGAQYSCNLETLTMARAEERRIDACQTRFLHAIFGILQPWLRPNDYNGRTVTMAREQLHIAPWS